MKSSILTKFIAAAALVALPVVAQAENSERRGARVGASEGAGPGSIIAIVLGLSAGLGGIIALGGESPTSP